MAFKIKERPGCITAAEMRALFEESIRQTKVFADNTPMGTMEVNGEFSHYMDSTTDSMWIGFAIGMRCAERRAALTPPAVAAPAQAGETKGGA
ncbi:hypothetical protein ACEN9J_02765 [Variovorax sp. Varisp41]|uniref:hypothetical protein n=1 Tax=Variovorax sp. Varisp41 TaxID=3243033 RepID=UPI0039B6CA6A